MKKTRTTGNPYGKGVAKLDQKLQDAAKGTEYPIDKLAESVEQA